MLESSNDYITAKAENQGGRMAQFKDLAIGLALAWLLGCSPSGGHDPPARTLESWTEPAGWGSGEAGGTWTYRVVGPDEAAPIEDHVLAAGGAGAGAAQFLAACLDAGPAVRTAGVGHAGRGRTAGDPDGHRPGD